MRSCKAVSELTALNKVRPLSVTEKISMFLHRAICAPCRAYKKQMERLEEELANVSDADAYTEERFDEARRRRILENIEAKRGED